MTEGETTFELEMDGSGRLVLRVGELRHDLGPAAAAVRRMQRCLDGITGACAVRFKGRTVDEWDRCWSDPMPLTGDFTMHRSDVGLYRALMGEETIYVGKAVEYLNGGLRKRLADYVRQNDSARRSTAGRYLFENRHRIQVGLLVVGSDAAAAETATQLEPAFIGRYAPRLNVHGLPRRQPFRSPKEDGRT